MLAAAAAGVYFVVALVFPVLRRRLPGAATGTGTLRVRYADGRGILRQVLNETTRRGFTINDLAVDPSRNGSGHHPAADGVDGDGPRQVTVTLHVWGRHPISELIGALSSLDQVGVMAGSDLDAVDD